MSRAPANHAPPRPHHPPARRIGLGFAVAGLTLATGSIGVHANATSVNATINVQVPVKSVTLVLPAPSLIYGSCTGGNSTASAMGFPNGQCTTPTYTVANSGNVAETIDVQGTNASPSDGLTPVWTLCFTTCAVAPTPGTDQYNNLTNGPGGQTALSTAPQCDQSINACTSQPAAGFSVTEFLLARGPSSSTDTSPSFSTTVTYTAL